MLVLVLTCHCLIEYVYMQLSNSYSRNPTDDIGNGGICTAAVRTDEKLRYFWAGVEVCNLLG